MIFYDTETCGLHGMPIIMQYAEDNGDIKIHHFWKSRIGESLDLIEYMMTQPVCGFNLSFDHFQLCKIYTTFHAMDDRDIYPEDCVDVIAQMEMIARDGPCVKPLAAMDLFLHAKKGPYQSCMDRHDIRIKRVPSGLAFQLAAELERRIKLKDIYFARKKDKHDKKRWQVEDILDDEGHLNPDFKDVVLKFQPSSALKVLAADALNLEDVTVFKDIQLPENYLPVELGYAPFAMAIGKPGKWNGAWPSVIRTHIDHWAFHKDARKYAADDVHYTRRLWDFFGNPEPGDDDSELACCVAAVRWHGFRIDAEKISALVKKCEAKSKEVPTDARQVKDWIFPLLSDEEREATGNSTGGTILETIAKNGDVCEKCAGDGCDTCRQHWDPILKLQFRLDQGMVPNEATLRARRVIAARGADKRKAELEKLLLAGRFHASLKVIGALSGRMSGADGLNPQGMPREDEFRICFPMAFPGYKLCGGDFDSFEVNIAVAVYKDESLYHDLTVGGKKMHALFAEELFPNETYESICASKGTLNDLYSAGKTGVFAKMYGGNENTLKVKVGVSLEIGKQANENWERRYPGIGHSQMRVKKMFEAMKQDGGIGSKINWSEPAEYMESLLGFRRYYTLENMICKALYDLANDPPRSWLHFKGKVTRRAERGEQMEHGAARSAIFAAAFAIQSANVRSATNHEIQSTGAGITKRVQRRVWDIQPAGAHPWRVMPINIHDEILCPTVPEYIDAVAERVKETVEFYRPVVPLIKMDWQTNMGTWADK